MRLAVDCDLAFLHCLQERGLCLRRSAVDFVGEQYICKDGPSPKIEVGGRNVEDVRAGYVGGHQVRRKLNPAKPRADNPGECFDRQCLSRTRHAFDKRMTLREYSHQYL